MANLLVYIRDDDSYEPVAKGATILRGDMVSVVGTSKIIERITRTMEFRDGKMISIHEEYDPLEITPLPSASDPPPQI